MEQYGNTTTFNLETVLRENIIRSQYWEKTCIDLDAWQEVVDEIYNSVEHCEPWMSGNARGPSSAFCLLYRLAQLKPTPVEIRLMVDHRDSPYIRAVGFLYLRYVCNPRELWSWYKKYLYDEEEISPSPGSLGKTITMGEFVRDIMLDQYYFETIFPRIPKPVQDKIVADLKEMGLPTAAKGNAGQGGPDRRGVDDGGKRPASVKASLSVAFGQRAPNRAGAREEGRGMGAGVEGGAGARRRSPSVDRYREPARKRSRSPHRGSERERGGSREEKYDPYDKYDKPRGDYDKYDKYDKPRGDYDKYSKYDRSERGREDKYDRQRSDRDRDRRGGEREGRDDRRRDYDRQRGGYDDRSRGGYRGGRDERRDDRRSPRRDREREEGRDARDVFRDKAGGAGAADRLKDMYG